MGQLGTRSMELYVHERRREHHLELPATYQTAMLDEMMSFAWIILEGSLPFQGLALEVSVASLTASIIRSWYNTLLVPMGSVCVCQFLTCLVA